MFFICFIIFYKINYFFSGKKKDLYVFVWKDFKDILLSGKKVFGRMKINMYSKILCVWKCMGEGV